MVPKKKNAFALNEKTMGDTDLETNSYIFHRGNVDKILDVLGKRLIEMSKTTNLLKGSGQLNDSDFTFYNRNGESVVDYLLLCKVDFPYITKFNILPITEFSDHCALNFYIERRSMPNDT
jgi:hypothetical protein